MLYIKKPIPVEAMEWTGYNFEDIQTFMKDAHVFKTTYGELVIPTLEGEMKALPGSYIIKGVKGEYYPCRKDVFMETYEPWNNFM